MNWQSVPGSKGRCKVVIEDWVGKDGEPHQSNRIKSFMEPEEISAVQEGTWKAGSF